MNRSDLKNIRLLNDQIAGGVMRIADLKSRALPSAIRFDDTGGSHPAPVNKIEEVFCLIDKEEKRVNRLIDKRYKLKQQAIKEIRATCRDYADRHILYLRYLSRTKDGNNLDWSDIERYVGKYHNISLRRIYQIHNIAVRRMEKHNI